MIIDLPDTTSSAVSKELVRIREDGGAIALGRVLTLVITTEPGREEVAIEAANDASREHPMRVIVLAPATDANGQAKVDAQIRVGGDAGASEVVVLRAYGEAARDPESLVTGLLLPDAPVVAWWPGSCPAAIAETAIGRMSQRRISDSAAHPDPVAALAGLAQHYRPGDTDFAWTRLTLWRTQLAAALDQPPYEPVTSVEVRGAADSPSTMLLAAWLQLALEVPVDLRLSAESKGAIGISGVRLQRPSGVLELERTENPLVRLVQPGQPDHDVSLPRRSLRDCLAEELRRLDPDDVFGDVVTRGLSALESARRP